MLPRPAPTPPHAERPTGWGIIGTGMIAHQFAAALADLPSARLAGISSRNGASARAFATEYDVIRSHEGHHRLLEDPEIEAVYISAPHTAHRQLAIDCIDAGKAALVEKPFTLNLSEAEAIVARARERGVFCMEAMWTRFLPLPQELRRVVADGSAIGEVEMFVASVGFRSPFDPHNRFFDPALGGGALLDTGVYAVNLATWLLGPVASVEGMAIIGDTGVDEYGAVVLRHESGALTAITNGNRSWLANSFELHGAEGTIRVHEPIYCPVRMTVHRHPVEPGDDGAADGGPDASSPLASAMSTLREQASRSEFLRTARRAAIRLRDAVYDGAIVRPYTGNGYAHEAAEVMRCLAAGRTESDVMPLDDSLRVMDTLDQIRRVWRLQYPADP